MYNVGEVIFLESVGNQAYAWPFTGSQISEVKDI